MKHVHQQLTTTCQNDVIESYKLSINPVFVPILINQELTCLAYIADNGTVDIPDILATAASL